MPLLNIGEGCAMFGCFAARHFTQSSKVLSRCLWKALMSM